MSLLALLEEDLSSQQKDQQISAGDLNCTLNFTMDSTGVDAVMHQIVTARMTMSSATVESALVHLDGKTVSR